MHREWRRQTRSKNAVLIGGRGRYAGRDKALAMAASGRLLAVEERGRSVFVKGDATAAYRVDNPNVRRVERDVHIVRERYLVVVDRVELEAPESLQWLFHAERAMDLGAETFRVTGTKAGLYGHFVLSTASKPALRQVEGFPGVRQIRDPGAREHWHLEAEVPPAARHSLVTLLVPYPLDAPRRVLHFIDDQGFSWDLYCVDEDDREFSSSFRRTSEPIRRRISLTTTITIRQAVPSRPGEDTAELREAFHVDGLFQADEVRLTYWRGPPRGRRRDARLARAAARSPEAIGTASSSIGARPHSSIWAARPGSADGEAFDLGALDILYLGRGARDVRMAGAGGEAAKLYIVSAPAHQSHPHRRITADEAKVLRLGSPETANIRTLLQFVHPDVCASCQLVLGITRLDAGSIWNTMPAHVHDRRCEAYLYFDMAPETRVFHFMGDPAETRHLVVANEEAILSPGWSIHSGAGTSRYSFVWAMAGDNQDFTDMDMVPMEALR